MSLDFTNFTDTVESITHVAVALAQKQPLNEYQQKLASDVLFDYLRLIEIRIAGNRRGGQKSRGGGAPKKNPSEWSPSYRKKMESKNRQAERKANKEDR